MRRLARVLSWLALPFVIYFGMAVIGAIVPRYAADISQQDSTHDVILVAGLIHYDILLPADDATIATFDFVQRAGVPVSDPQVRWLSVGWGSAAFYTTAGRYSDLTADAVWTAATGDNAVMRFEVTGPLPVHPKLRRITLSTAQLNALRASIRADLGPTPRALPLDGFSQTDAFYDANGRFHVLATCNTWVARKLGDAGLTFGRWTPTPYAVTLSLWWHGHLD